jgi:hypothetical protein
MHRPCIETAGDSIGDRRHYLEINNICFFGEIDCLYFGYHKRNILRDGLTGHSLLFTFIGAVTKSL